MKVIIILVVLLIIVTIRGVFLEKRRRLMLFSEYKEEFGKQNRKSYTSGTGHRSAIIKRNDDCFIDDITWSDLNMEDIYERIDATKSAIGEEYLYYLLHRTENRKCVEDFDKLVCYYLEHEDERVNMQLALHDIGYLGKLSPYDYLDYLTSREAKSPVFDIICDLLFIPLIALTVFKPLIGGVLLFVLLCFNIFKYFKDKKELDGIIGTLSFLIRLISNANSYANSDVNELFAEDIKYLQDNEVFLKKIKARGTYLAVSGKNVAGATSSSSPIELVINYLNMVFHIDLIQYMLLLKEINGKYEVFNDILMLFGKYDAAISVASFRKSLNNGYCKPSFSEENTAKISVIEGYHPLIEKPVVNSINSSNGILLTGSNASGKSTFLRCIAVNAILAQSIYTVCAKEYIAPMFKIYSSIALKDNLADNESYFIVEIKSLKRIINAAGKDMPILCFVDEVLRGTNTVERISASKVILESLEPLNVICFAATHDGELADLLDGKYTNYHFSETIENNDISFDYKLREGKATSRNALALLKIYGYPENITTEAEKMARKLDIK